MIVVSQSEPLVMKGELMPFPALQVLDNDGTPVNLTDAILSLTPEEGGETLDKIGAKSGQTWEFPWLEGETDIPRRWRTLLRITTEPPTETLFGPTYTVYDPAALWVDPTYVLAIVGEGYTQGQVVGAILFAQGIVRAWVGEVQSPVPDPIRQATTLLAAHALTTTTASESGTVVSETIADYTVRYATPEDITTGGIPPSIVALLAPYHARVGMTKIGPANVSSPLPVILDTETLYEGWWYDPIIYDEEYP